MKPREWWAVLETEEDGDEGYSSGSICSDGGGNLYWQDNRFKVIEKSAYDRLEAMSEKLAGFLKDAQCECTVVERESGHLVGCWRPEVDEALAEYRAMRYETKMPCPRNE